MTANTYPIQIKKRLLFSLISAGLRTILSIYFLALFLPTPAIFPFFNNSISIFSVIIFILILGLIIQLIWQFLYLNSLKYNLDQKNITYQGGIISRFEKIIPYSKIQHIILYESFWQRILGLSSVSIETARESGANNNHGYQSMNNLAFAAHATLPTGPFIPDLNREDAQKLKDYLVAVANKYKSRAGI